MVPFKQAILEEMRRNAEREAAELAGEFARAAQEEREAVLAALEIEQWISVSCRESLSRRKARG